MRNYKPPDRTPAPRLLGFDENIDSQHVATRVTASLETKQGTIGEMMCLLENDSRCLFISIAWMSDC
jgi:hypothetical protein